MEIKQNLFVPNKFNYVKGKRPDVECILCAVRDKRPNVDNLVIYKNELFLITLNLYPYNPGHLMIFPKRHITDVRNLKIKENNNLFKLQKFCLDTLDKEYQPCGYNLGFNIGRAGGASIEHIHFHIVPRYKSEIGLIEIFSNARLIVESPLKTQKKLMKYFAKCKI